MSEFIDFLINDLIKQMNSNKELKEIYSSIDFSQKRSLFFSKILVF